MIASTQFDLEIFSGIASGHLCASVLKHGDPCGREIDRAHGIGLCTWHSEEAKGFPHAGEDAEVGGKHCIRCHHRPVAFRMTRLCGNCHKVTMQRERRRLKSEEIAVGQIVER